MEEKSSLIITPTIKIVKNIEADLTEIFEEERFVSFPVLHKQKQQGYCLAFFAYYFITINNSGTKAPSYPTHVYLMDIQSGETIDRFSTKDSNPFSNKNNGSVLMRDAYVQKMSVQGKINLWHLMDALRLDYLSSGEVDSKKYQNYLDQIKSVVSIDFAA